MVVSEIDPEIYQRGAGFTRPHRHPKEEGKNIHQE
jgi:hypothetical protein